MTPRLCRIVSTVAGRRRWSSCEGTSHRLRLSREPHYICNLCQALALQSPRGTAPHSRRPRSPRLDRKSTRLNSSHRTISYAVFCLKKKKKNNHIKSSQKKKKKKKKKYKYEPI